MSFKESDALRYLASKQKQGQFSTKKDRDTALSYQEQAREVKKQEEFFVKSLLDKLRAEYSRLISGSTVDYKQLNFARTFLHYKFGGGRPMYIDITGMHLPSLSPKDFNNEVGRVESKNTFNLPISQMLNVGVCIGKVKFKYLGNNRVKIVDHDVYDFNIEWKKGVTWRNIFTAYAGLLHNIPVGIEPSIINLLTSGGTSYDIYFKGEATIGN